LADERGDFAGRARPAIPGKNPVYRTASAASIGEEDKTSDL